ncbi:MAG: hypothetical protein C0506_03895 [Anaerolinea sp.]|nr:hypothetical protein [Anaerolinea sp.]
MRYFALLAAAILPAGLTGAIVLRASSSHGAEETTAPAMESQVAGGGYQMVLPSVGRDGTFPAVSVSLASVFQGGALMVSVGDAQSGSVSVFGRSYVLSPDGEGGLAGFVGFGTEDPPGPTSLTIQLVDQIGDGRVYTKPLVVKGTQWTVDSFTVPPPPPPDPNAPPPPPPPPNENPLLPAVYAGITARQWQPGWVSPFTEPDLGPCNGAPPVNVACVSGYFGEERVINGVPQAGHHGGTDFGAYAGTPVWATNSGTVVMSGLYLVRGNLVVIDHGGGVFSLYGHMEDRAVAVGDVVSKGQLVGRVGSTGFSTGPHLHWEVSVGGILVDGLRWLDGTQGF